MKYIILLTIILLNILFANELQQAVIKNDTKKAIQFIKSGANLYQYADESSIRKIITPNLKTTYIDGMEYDVFPLVILAAANGNTKIIKAMYDEFEFSIYLKDKYKNDALMWAAREGKVEVVELLLSYGFDPLYKASNTTAYDLAIRYGQIEVLKIFIDKLLKNKNYKKLEYTIWAMARDKSDIVEKLLKAGIKDNYKAIHPRTTLTKVAETSNIKRFDLLVKYGSNPYEGNTGSIKQGYNPLLAALIHSKKMALHLLKNYHFDLTQTYKGKTLNQLTRYKEIKKILKQSRERVNRTKDAKTVSKRATN